MAKMKDLILEVVELLDAGMSPEVICEYLNLDPKTFQEIVSWIDSDDMK